MSPCYLTYLKRSLVFPILLFSSISLHCSLRKAFFFFNLSLLFFGTLHSHGYIFPFLLCLLHLFFSQLLVRPPQTAVLPFFFLGMVLITISIHTPLLPCGLVLGAFPQVHAHTWLIINSWTTHTDLDWRNFTNLTTDISAGICYIFTYVKSKKKKPYFFLYISSFFWRSNFQS